MKSKKKLRKVLIKSRRNGDLIFSTEAHNLKEAVEIAVKEGKNLNNADLCNANLSGADLNSANLNNAELFGAYLRNANLSGADLNNANLIFANLSGADLNNANLIFANLSGADLSNASMRGTRLTGSNMDDANIWGARGFNKYLSTPLYFLHDQIGKIRAYKITKSNGVGIYYPSTTYEVGKTYTVGLADCNEQKRCAPGISLATLDWCIEEWKEGYRIFIAEFTAKDIAAIPIGSDGQFRVKRCKIVAEKDLQESGILDL